MAHSLPRIAWSFSSTSWSLWKRPPTYPGPVAGTLGTTAPPEQGRELADPEVPG